MLKGEALQVVNAIKVKGFNWSKMGHLINGIKDGLDKLRSWSIAYIKKDVNYVVHFLTCKVIYFCYRYNLN
jgi:hypothetical protein